MIYFKRERQIQLLKRFAEVMNPCGYLFIGHSETLVNMNLPFRVRWNTDPDMSLGLKISLR